MAGEDEMVSLDPAIVRREKAVRITMLLYAPKKAQKSEAPVVQVKTPEYMASRDEAKNGSAIVE